MRRPSLTALHVALTMPLLFGCQTLPSDTANRVDGLSIVLTQPTNLGTPVNPVQVQSATFDVLARDDQGLPWTHDVDVDLYVSFGGVKAGAITSCGASSDPLQHLKLPGGVARGVTLALPQAFGPTSLWVQQSNGGPAGASDNIHFRNPYISDIMKPLDVAAPEAAYCTPFTGKFIIIDQAQNGGKLVISSVFGNAVVISDSGAADFGSTYLFTFGRPSASAVPGRVVNRFSGNISKFVGFTEFNFPQLDLADEIDVKAIPAVKVLTSADLANVPKLLALSAAPVQVTGIICDANPPNPSADPMIQSTIDQWNKFNTFVISAGSNTCDSFNNFAVALPSKQVGNFNPLTMVGQTVTVAGMLKNNSGANNYLDGGGKPISCSPTTACAQGSCVVGLCKKAPFNFWTVVVRTAADVGQ